MKETFANVSNDVMLLRRQIYPIRFSLRALAGYGPEYAIQLMEEPSDPRDYVGWLHQQAQQRLDAQFKAARLHVRLSIAQQFRYFRERRRKGL